MGIIAAGQITVVDLSDAPVLNTFITASRPTTQTYSKDSRTYKPSYASTPQVLTLKVTKAGSTANIIDSISSLHWFVVDGPIKTEITSKDNSANEYISGTHNEILTTKLDIDLNKGSKRYEVMGIWPDPSTGLDVQFGGYIDLLLTQNGATGPQGPQGNTGNGIANTVITYGLSMSDTTEPATWSSEMPALVKGMYLWTRTVIIYTNGSSTTSYQISYIAKDADATAEIDKAKQELLEKLETVRDESLEAVDEAKQQLVTVRDESLAAAEEAKQGLANVNTKVDNAKAEIDKAKQDLTNVASELNTAKQELADSVTAVNNKVDSAKAEVTQAKQQLTTVADDLSTAKQDFQNAVSAVDTKATNLQSDLTQAKQDLASQAQQLQEQAGAQSELTNRVSSVEKTANSTKTTVSELSKTVAQNGKDITSVTARTKVVEDDLAGTKTTLSQVQTTANSTSQKTATLETGLNGLSAKFNSLSVGNKNYLPASRVVNRGCSNFSYSNTTKSWTMTAPASSSTFGNGITFNTNGLNILLNGGETLFFGLMIKANKACSFNYDVNNALSGTTSNDNDDTSKRAHSPSNKSIPANVWTKVWFSYTAKANVSITENNSKFGIVNNTEPVTIEIKEVMVAKSNVPVDYQTPDADVEQKIAEYKQNADQNYASLQTTVQNLDGTVQHNKTVADQTAQGFTTRIESLETYKDGESTRANQYFESAKTETARQLTAERTAIAKDYVAKSTYTSDVTGIRNELSATTSTANTTKTNLANYQASNDKMVASLKSSLQTTDGNVSNLQTKVEAVPGQITSAVSAVEGKIPTSSGGRNLAQGTSKDWSKPFTGFSGIQNTGVNLYRVLTDGLSVGDTLKSRIVLKYTDIVPTSGQKAIIRLQGSGNVSAWGPGGYNFSTWKTISGSGEVIFEHEFKITADHLKNDYWNMAFRTDWIASGSLQWKLAKAERGMFFTDWSPAPEDTISQISNLSSEIKQTADGITLLATKTELNNAKNELQSGISTATSKADNAQATANSNAQTISTHTTQISALNTGLQAKVSQTDFNTLSGRVTTAENNITAKANELSSKITSVEGAIEDTQSDITKLSSEIKQTADGMTLLATKTELNTAKSDLQSGINTATNKANAAQNTADSAVTKANSAQSTANNNAQTINTHTTQISALNTGLQAKVSQSEFNTLSGRVTTAENNIIAKANELSSKITTVEGKIPTSSGGRNLAQGTSKDWSKPFTNFKGTENTCPDLYKVLVDGLSVGDTLKSRIVLKYTDIVPTSGKTAKIRMQGSGNVTAWGSGGYNITTWKTISGSGEVIFEHKFIIEADHLKNSYWNWAFRTDYIASGSLQWKLAKVERGMFFTDWSPAPEDTAEQISNLSSEIKQTADGMTLLATKTELNTAKNELQSGINTATNKANNAQSTANNNAQTISTHTTQISALNTGLQAKVSQTEFNTLSGRVTNAENNITAKANELSSKITSVEGKIPTSVGGRNLWIQSKATGGFVEETLPDNHVTGQKKCYRIPNNQKLYFNIEPDFSSRLYQKVTFSAWVKYENVVQGDKSWNKFNCFKHGLVRKNSSTGATTDTDNLTIVSFTGTSDWKYITYTYDYAANKSYDQLKTSIRFHLESARSGTAWVTGVKIELGSIPSDYSPAPEDTAEQISNLSSEIKQTADGMTLLATKTELNNAKTELQSGINTATNKANNNAQTINTHTTQISALNTGLSAKVSQTEFNTLSGRVTSAENNITAKANELTSKITTVEGKIPKSVGVRNLLIKTNQGKTNWSWIISSGGTTAENYDADGVNAVKLTRTSDASFTWHYIAYEGLIRKLIKPNTKYTLSFDVKPSVDVTFTASLQRGDAREPLTNGASMNKATANQWTKVTCVLTSKATLPDDLSQVVYLSGMPVGNGNWLIIKNIKLEEGVVSSDWQPAPEDTISQISSLSSELKQTKDGITLLATKTELNTAKNELQSGINTATNKANSNAQTISTHTSQISALNTGLSAKVSQSDFNTLSGRVTTAENNITAKANELSSKITSVEGKLPTSVSHRNLVQGTSSSWSPFVNISTNTNWCYSLATIKYGDSTGIRDGTTINIFVYLSADELTLGGPSPSIRIQGMVIDKNGNLTWTNWDKYHPFKSKWSSNLVSGNNYRIVKLSSKVTSESFSNINGFEIGIRIDGVQSGKFHHRALMVTTGDIFPDSWSPAPEDAINQINSVSSEFKQTTDAIKASVTSLDKSTVKSSSLTINSDGIVMKAGKSTTDVANAIGSYFAVNQNAIDLFADKIKVKGNMIVNGTITGDKIKASSVDVSKIVGIDANFIKSKIEHAMIDWLKGKTITAYNDNMTIDLQNGRISFKDGSNAVYRQTSDGIHTGFLHFEAGSQGGVYAAFGTTSTRQGINSKSSEFAGIRCYRVSANGDSHAAKIDKIELIGDTVQFGHTYHPNGTIGGGFIMNTAAYYDDPPYSLNRMVSSIDSLWRILYVHGKNVGYNLSHPNFINALRDEYNAWHDMHNR